MSRIAGIFSLNIKGMVYRVLRLFRLNRLAGRIFYRAFHGFAPAGRDLPEAVEKSFSIADESGVLNAGDYCEFGIFKGYTFLHAQKVAGRYSTDTMRFFGFDSFEGLPPPKGADLVNDGHQPFYEGQYAASIDYVTAQLDKGGADWSRTHLVQGYFNESLVREDVANHKIEKVSIALVDCDLYSSTVDVLDFLDSRLVDGAIVLMDDWKSYGDAADKGQPQALKEFLDNGSNWRCEELFDYGEFGKVFRFQKAA